MFPWKAQSQDVAVRWFSHTHNSLQVKSASSIWSLNKIRNQLCLHHPHPRPQSAPSFFQGGNHKSSSHLSRGFSLDHPCRSFFTDTQLYPKSSCLLVCSRIISTQLPCRRNLFLFPLPSLTLCPTSDLNF